MALEKAQTMVNKGAEPVFSPRQKTLLTLLGYKRWVLRSTVGRGTALLPQATEKANISPASSEHALSVKRNQEENNACIFSLAKCQASLWASRNYTVLFGGKLSYYWLLPPLWATEKALVLFAGEQERKLWLAALEAVGLNIEAEIFRDVFRSDIALQSIPDIAFSALPNRITAKKTMALCQTAVSLSLSDKNENIYPVLPPLLVLRQSQKKKLLWQQLLALKEKIY